MSRRLQPGETPAMRAAERTADLRLRQRPSPPVPGRLDRGIRKAVEILQANGVETYQSCEGGPGHSYPEPTICFYGTVAAGMRAVAVALDFGMPVLDLRRTW